MDAELKIKFQEIIDLVVQKQVLDAEKKLIALTEKVNDLIDFAVTDKELQELSKYSVLLTNLESKIIALKASLN